MLVNELKTEIEKYSEKELKKIIIELYKRIPKRKKEDYNIDEFIKDIKSKESNVKKKKSFEELQEEIIYFIKCVDNEYYIVPNKIISKKERSSWRFKVKRYYKELNNILPNSTNGAIATILLIEIFKRLSIGSNRLLFINWETFKALGVSQGNYYDTIIKRILYSGYTKDNLEKCIELLEVFKDPYELSYDMFWVFISNLKTIDNKKQSIELLNNKVEEMKTKLLTIKDSHLAFVIKEDINNYVICILELYLILSEYEKGIKYFHKHFIEEHKEVKEYILLSKLDDLDLKDEWLKEYERKMDKINLRDSLKKKYNELKKV